MSVFNWKSSSFRTLSNTGCFIASSIVILFLGSNTKVFMRKSYHYGRQYENISLGLFLSYFGSDFRYFRATSSSTKDISSGDGVPTNCNIFDLDHNRSTSGHLQNAEIHSLFCKYSPYCPWEVKGESMPSPKTKPSWVL